MYVLHVKTGREDAVAKRLREIGLKPTVPKTVIYHRSKGKWHERVEILFTGYIFVEMVFSPEIYYKLIEIDGVITLLRNGMTPVKLSYLEQEWIKLLGYEEIIQPTPIRFNDTGKAVAECGVLKAFESKITKVDKHKRTATFEIPLIGKRKSITLAIDIDKKDDLENEIVNEDMGA